MFAEMRSHFVPAVGTIVEFTSRAAKHSLGSSSSGGGLFGRPVTRKRHGTLLKFWGRSAVTPAKDPVHMHTLWCRKP